MHVQAERMSFAAARQSSLPFRLDSINLPSPCGKNAWEMPESSISWRVPLKIPSAINSSQRTRWHSKCRSSQ